MNIAIVRKYLVIHTWTGIVSSLMLFVAFYAGALSMFEPEITQWAQADQRITDAGTDIDKLADVFFASRVDLPPRVTLSLPSETGIAAFHYEEDGQRFRAWLDGAGHLQSGPSPSYAAGDFVDHIHRQGGLPLTLEASEPIIGIVALVYGVALVSGVIVLLPSLLRDLFVLRLARNVKRMWLDAHNLVGIGSLPFHVVMALSAAVFCLHDIVYDAQNTLVYRGSPPAEVLPPVKRAPGVDVSDTRAWLSPSQVIQHLDAAAPSFVPMTLRYRLAGPNAATVQATGGDDTHFKRSPREGYVVLDLLGGDVVDTTYLAGQETGWGAWLSGFFAMHFGSYGGLPVRLMYAVLGILGAFLFYSGNLLWIETRSKRARQDPAVLERPRHVHCLASLTIGASAGCIAGLSLAIAASRWLARAPVSPEAVAHVAYFATFAACLAFAFLRGFERASAPLLVAAALATVFIPLTSLFAQFGLWGGANKSYASAYFLVDVLSLGGALLLLFVARIAQRRLRRSSSSVSSPSLHHTNKITQP